MKPPVQAILIGGHHMRDDVQNKKKSTVIRKGHRHYELGTVLIGNEDPSWAVIRRIISVKHITIGEVERRDSIDHGFAGREQMLNFFKIMYPGTGDDLKVTVVRWMI